MKRYIKSAEEKQTVTDLFEEKKDNVEDDFAYLLAGVDKMVRDGESLESAIQILNGLSDAIQGFIDQVAGEVRE